MQRRTWILIGLIGGAASMACLALGFLAVFAIGFASGPRNLGGPVAIVQGEMPTHGFLGVVFEDWDSPLVVRSVVPESGAAEAGVLPGDVLLMFQDRPEPSGIQMQDTLQSTKPGEEIPITVRRGEDELELRVRLISFREMAILRERQRLAEEAPRDD